MMLLKDICSKNKDGDIMSPEYEAIHKEIAVDWPDWKRKVYNAKNALLKHAKKIESEKQSKNMIPDIMQRLGVKPDEKFGISGDYWERKYMFLGSSLVRVDPNGSLPLKADDILIKLIKGEAEVAKLQYRPMYGETYFMVMWSKDNTPSVKECTWLDDGIDFAMLSLKNIFRTAAEAEKEKENVVRRSKEMKLCL